MEEVMRFVVLRAPEETDDPPNRIDLLDPDDDSAIDTIDRLREGGTSEADPPKLGDLGLQLESLEAWLRRSDDETDPGAKIEEIFGVTNPVSTDAWNVARAALSEALLDGKFRVGENRRKLGQHARWRRAMFATETLIAGGSPQARGGRNASDDPEGALHTRAQVALDAFFAIPKPTPHEPEDGRQSDEYQEKKKVAFDKARDVIAEHEGLGEARAHFGAIAGHHLTMVEDDPAPVERAPTTQPRSSWGGLLGWLGGGQAVDSATAPPASKLVIKESALEGLSENARTVLERSGIELDSQPYEETLELLHREGRRARMDVTALLAPFTTEDVALEWRGVHFDASSPVRRPESLVDRHALAPSEYVSLYLPGTEYHPPADEAAEEVPACSPIEPSGFGQLLVIRQDLKCYGRSEISHVENVLQGETRTRDHRRSVTTEETFLFEQETETTVERHLETTGRFELASEVERQAKSESAVKGELNVSGKYGPTVEFEASASAEVKNSKEKSVRVAQEFSQETVEKAVNKISERVREQRTRRIVEEIQESNHHGFVNDSPGQIIGIYQWLDKIYEAQMFDYGLRQLFDIVVPEPAVFLIAAFLAQQSQTRARIPKPVPFNLDPEMLRESNYTTYVDRYAARDVQVPPDQLKTVAKSFALSDRADNWKKTAHAESAEIDLPAGYEAVYAYMTATFTGQATGNTPSRVEIHLDRTWYQFNLAGNGGNPPQKTTASTPMNNQQGKVPAGWRARRVESAVATIEIRCRRTEAAMDQWRLDTHEKIKTAYEQKLAQYLAEQDKLALDATEELEGSNPAENRRVVETELKRAAISIIANQRQLFDLIDIDAHDIPFVDLAARLQADPTIRFLEQAFEWENMNYVFYPYFWGRKEPQWKQKVLFEDNDSAFADFVRSGAARVQLAVRPGFEDAVDHFLKTCEPWMGGDLPTISDPLYLAFADELASQLGRPGAEVPVGDPWDVVVPTNLVLLREHGDLPKWEQQDDGTWAEVEPEEDETDEDGDGDSDSDG